MTTPLPFLALLAALAPATTPQAGERAGLGTELPGSEGPLLNDSFLAASTTLRPALASGDAAWERSRQAALPGDARRERIAAFESWRQVLVNSASGDRVVFLPGPGGTPDPSGERERRLVEGVEQAVLRRLTRIESAARDEWREHFAAASSAALAGAHHDSAALAEVERGFPATEAALRAALVAGDLALETGRPSTARTWWARAERHARLGAGRASTADGGERDQLAGAIARRRAAADQLAVGAAGRSSGRSLESWRTATKLELEHALPIGPPVRGRSRRDDAPGTGVRPGLAFLGDGRVAVQTPEEVFLFDVESGRPAGSFQPLEALADGGLPGLRPPLWSAPGTPGWALAPTADGDRVLLVLGRAGSSRGNLLTSFRVPSAPSPLAAPEDRLPQLVWAISGARWFHRGAENRLGSLAGWEEAEIQPGPIVVGELVIAQVRERAEDVRAWLAAFDRRTGEPQWRTRLAGGADLLPPRRRTDFRGGVLGHAAQAPVLIGERVFAGTHLGVGALVDALDGRAVWSWKGRRRDVLDDGWTGAPPPFGTPSGTDRAAVVGWAAHDSDRLYWLEAAPIEGASPLVHPPREIGEAQALVAADREQAIVLGRAGRHGTLSAWGAASGSRHDSFYLAAGERFSGAALSSGARVLFGTDRALYLVDRTRELYLLDSARLPPETPRMGSSLYGRGGRVLHLSPSELLVFECRE